MQHEITEKHNVFEENGEVMCAGWARTPVFEYNSEQSKTSGKHSERDCYFISNTEVSLYLSVENLGMEFAVKIAVADLKRGGVIYDCVVKKFVFSKNELPESGSSGELLYTDKRLQLQLTNTPNGRFLKCDFIDFGGIKNLYFNINLKKTAGESLNEIAPFERDRKYFYLKRFVPKFGNKAFEIKIFSVSLKRCNFVKTFARRLFEINVKVKIFYAAKVDKITF